MKYQALFFDLDGTLVSESMVITSKTKESIKTIKDKVKVCIVSGRQKEIVLRYAQELELDYYQICDGGSRVINLHGNTIWKTSINEAVSRNIIDIICQFEIKNFVISENEKTIFSIEDIESWDISKIAFLAMTDEACANIINGISNIPEIKFFKTKQPQQQVWNIDITHTHGTKFDGVAKVIELYGLNKESTIGIGDGFNDIPLLEATGLKIAMANSPDELKSVADYVTSSVYEDGLAKVIDKFII